MELIILFPVNAQQHILKNLGEAVFSTKSKADMDELIAILLQVKQSKIRANHTDKDIGPLFGHAMILPKHELRC
jgi:hypothetical protein